MNSGTHVRKEMSGSVADRLILAQHAQTQVTIEKIVSRACAQQHGSNKPGVVRHEDQHEEHAERQCDDI